MPSHACASNQKLQTSATCIWASRAASSKLTKYIVTRRVLDHFTYCTSWSPLTAVLLGFWNALHLQIFATRVCFQIGKIQTAEQELKERSVYSAWECTQHCSYGSCLVKPIKSARVVILCNSLVITPTLGNMEGGFFSPLVFHLMESCCHTLTTALTTKKHDE